MLVSSSRCVSETVRPPSPGLVGTGDRRQRPETLHDPVPGASAAVAPFGGRKRGRASVPPVVRRRPRVSDVQPERLIALGAAHEIDHVTLLYTETTTYSPSTRTGYCRSLIPG